MIGAPTIRPLVCSRSETSELPRQDVNDHAPPTAPTAHRANPQRDGVYPLMAPRVIPAEKMSAGVPARGVAWPVRAGAVPPLAAAFTVRTDSVPRIESLLEPGGTVALVPGPEGAGDAAGWLGSCGKTQLAAYVAETLWQSRGVELLAWVNASDRASVLAGYTEAAAQLGLDDGSDAELAAARFLGWLGSTARPWLVVLDDVRDAADLDGLLPGGRAGRVLVTAAEGGAVPGARLVTVPAFSLREAMSYLSGRLTTYPEHRNGAYDLAEDLGAEPAALALAGAVMAGSETGCRTYQARFARHRERLLRAAAGGRRLPAAAVAWMLSAEFAEELLPGGGTWPLLVLAALLDSGGIPLAVLAGPAACRYLAGAGVAAADAQRARSAVGALEQAGLVTVGPAVQMSRPLQPAELLGRAARAAADAVLEAWPDDQPRSVLAGQLRACAASLLRHAGDALWDGGSCHRVLLAAGQSLAAARLTGPAVSWWREVAARSERLLGPDHPDTLTVVADWKNGPHTLTYRQAEYTFGLVARALSKDKPDGLPSPELQAACDGLLEASVPGQFKNASRPLAVDWTDLESFSRPPPHGTRDCAGPEASWGHRRNNLLRSADELFFGYYFSAGTMEREENGPQVPELTRRMTVCSCRRDPARALVPVLTAMPRQGIPLGDLLADSGYSHRDADAWALPLRAAGAQLVQDLHPHDRGPKGTCQGAIISNGNLYCPKAPRSLLELSPLARDATRGQAAAHDGKTAELARYKLGKITADDAGGYHRVQCPAAMGKIRCALRPASMTLDRGRPEILTPPEHPQACCTQQAVTVPRGQRGNQAEARLPLRGLAPLLRPPHRRRARLRHRQGPRQQRHLPRLVPPHGPGAPDALRRHPADRPQPAHPGSLGRPPGRQRPPRREGPAAQDPQATPQDPHHARHRATLTPGSRAASTITSTTTAPARHQRATSNPRTANRAPPAPYSTTQPGRTTIPLRSQPQT